MINFFYSNYSVSRKVLILKTNIKTKKHVKTLKSFFDNHSNIVKWNIDLEDVDNVLKIEATPNINEQVIIEQIKTFGFQCDVLEG